MVSMQYARNLREGYGLVWIPEKEPVQGFTNLGVTLVMAGIHLLPISETRISLVVQLVNLSLLGVILFLVWRIGEWIYIERWAALAGAVGFALCGPVAIWGLQGSDVGFVTLWLVACVGLVARQAFADRCWPPLVFPLFALGPFLRLDASIFLVAFLLVCWTHSGDRKRQVLTGIALVGTTVVALMVFSQYYYGDPLPNTYYLKATGSPRWYVLASGARQTLEWLPWLLPGLLLSVVALWEYWSHPVIRLCALLVITSFTYNLWVGGDWGHEWGSRFVAPSLPMLVLLVVAGIQCIGRRISSMKNFRPKSDFGPVALISLVTIVCVAINPTASRVEWLTPTPVTMYRNYNELFYRFASYIKEKTSLSMSIGVHWAGTLPYFSHRSAIDVLGKSDRHIAKLKVPRFIPGHSKWDWDYIVNERRPDIIVGHSRGLGAVQKFRDSYYLVSFRGELTFFVRKGALAELFDNELIVRDLWTEESFSRLELVNQTEVPDPLGN